MEDFKMILHKFTRPFDDEEDASECHQNMCKFLFNIQIFANSSQKEKSSFLEDVSQAVNQSGFQQRLQASLAHSDDIVSAYIEVVIGLTKSGMLPSVKGNDDEVYPEEHITSTLKNVTIIMCLIRSLLEQLWDCLDKLHSRDGGPNVGRKVLKLCAPLCIMLCAAHRNVHPWSSYKSMAASGELLQLLYKMSSSTSISDLLGGGSRQDETSAGCYGDVLICLRSRLTRQTWKEEPSSRHAYYWCLLQVKHPHLGAHLESVLPPALLFADDYKVENKILGIKCLLHIIENVDPTELRWYGRGLVIYEALHHHLYNQDPALLDILYPCMLAILGVIETPAHRTDEIRKPNRYDDVFQTILTNMEFEQKLVLRITHARCLAGFIDKMAITVLRHMKRLLRVLVNYLEVNDGPGHTARLDILRALKVLITQAWPRIPHHCDTIMKSLLKLLYDITTADVGDMSKSDLNELLNHTGDCFVLLKKCCGSHVDQTLQSIQGCEATNQLLDSCLQTVLSGT